LYSEEKDFSSCPAVTTPASKKSHPYGTAFYWYFRTHCLFKKK